MSRPLHLDISEQLRQRINQGDYPPGAQLPSERELIAAFNVSRITVRRAIANLVDQGLAIAQQGKGVFVTERRKAAYTLTNPGLFLVEDLARQGITVTLQTIAFECVTPPEPVQKVLQLPKREPIAYLQKKILYMDQVPGCVDVTYLLPELGEVLADELKHHMTFPTLAQHGMPIERVDAIIECQSADPELSQQLQVPLGHALLVYRHTAYTQGDRPVLYGDSISRGDRFCYAVSLDHRR